MQRDAVHGGRAGAHRRCHGLEVKQRVIPVDIDLLLEIDVAEKRTVVTGIRVDVTSLRIGHLVRVHLCIHGLTAVVILTIAGIAVIDLV